MSQTATSDPTIGQDTERLNELAFSFKKSQALAAAQREEQYVVTTGTGSGKSLTYLVPIVDHILKNDPDKQALFKCRWPR